MREKRERFKKKINVYHEIRDANKEARWFLVEFRLDIPMSANDLLEVLMNRVGEII